MAGAPLPVAEACLYSDAVSLFDCFCGTEFLITTANPLFPCRSFPFITGVRMPAHARHPLGFEDLFRAINLLTLEEVQAKASSGMKSKKGGSFSSPSSGSGGRGSGVSMQQLRHMWVQPQEMGLQEFDVEALRAAWQHILEQGGFAGLYDTSEFLSVCLRSFGAKSNIFVSFTSAHLQEWAQWPSSATSATCTCHPPLW